MDGVSADSPRHARVAGLMAVLFALLFVAGLTLVHRSPGLAASDSAYTAFHAGSSSTVVTVGL